MVLIISYKPFLAFVLASAICFGETSATCTDPSVRQEWSSVTQTERDAYITAVKCLATRPSRIGLNTTLYDDFPHTHNALNHQIHFVASFLPWHRYWIHIYEQALQNQCGYTGSLLYWDWTLGASNPANDAVWDPITGVGGNGNVTTYCVTDGPFNSLFPAYLADNYSPHCLQRTFNDGSDNVGDMLGEYYTAAAVAEINTLNDYNDFRIQLESGPHGAVHSAIGGDMSPATSPNDPIFFLHHTQVDRLWWLWQTADPANRTNDFSGFRTQVSTETPNPPPASINDILPMLGMDVDIPVSEVMSTTTDLLCYSY